MTKMERPQVLNVGKETGQSFRDAPAPLDVEAPLNRSMEANCFRKPFLPLRASKQAHFNRCGLSLFKNSWYASELSFWNPDTKFLPTRAFGLNPLIGQNDRYASHSHCVKESDTGCAHTSRAKN